MDKPRTNQQNKSLHLWCTQTAEQLNEGGLDKRLVMESLQIDVPWSMDSVKNDLFNHIALEMFDRTSSQLTTGELQTVFKILEKAMQEGLGIQCLPWPDIYSQSLEK
jgi:hypothetical protein